MAKSPSLDIILPCYNPGKEWTSVVLNSFNKIKELLVDTKVNLIIINDGSVKGFDNKAADYLKQNIPELTIETNSKNKGKGYTVRKGVIMSKADFQIYTDVEFPYRDEDVAGIFKKLKDGNCDIVIGSRNKSYYDSIPKMRAFVSKLLRSVIKMLLNTTIIDTQAGLKGFNAEGKNIFLETTIDRYLFDLEFILLCSKRKEISICQHPIFLKDNVSFSKINWSLLFKEFVNFLKILSKHSRF